MKLPSDAQARLLSRVSDLEREGREVFWTTEQGHARAAIFYEKEDRERHIAGFEHLFRLYREQPMVKTVRAAIRAGWLDDTHERIFSSGLPLIGVIYACDDPDPVVVEQLTLTEDGRIALGVWRERKMAAPPVQLEISDREREVIELADRALKLGYALCAREPARQEARRMKKAGLLNGCWVAHNPDGLVPAAPAVVEVFPERADSPEPMRDLL